MMPGVLDRMSLELTNTETGIRMPMFIHSMSIEHSFHGPVKYLIEAEVYDVTKLQYDKKWQEPEPDEFEEKLLELAERFVVAAETIAAALDREPE